MSNFVALKECRRQLYKQTIGIDDVKWKRQQRRLLIKKWKSHIASVQKRAVTIACDSNHFRCSSSQSKKDEELRLNLERLINLPADDKAAQVEIELSSLCYNRPLELVSAGALPIFVKGLISECDHIQERAAWCLAKLAVLDMGLRDAILEEEGALAALKSNIERQNALNLSLGYIHLMIGLLNHPILPPIAVVVDWRDFLSFIILNVEPNTPRLKLVVQTTLVISFISKYPEVDFSGSLLKKLVAYLGHSSVELVEPALIILGNTVIKKEEAAQAALDAGVLQHIKRLLENERTQESTCYLLANIAAGTPEQMQMLFKPSIVQIFKKVAHLACGDYRFSLKAHALSVIVTVIKNGRDCHIMLLDELSCVAAVCEALYFTTDVNILKPVLEALTSILDVCASIHFNYRQRMEQRGVQEKLEELLNHPNRVVSNMCSCILDKYFSGTEDDDTFSFGEDVLQENVYPIDHTAEHKEQNSVVADVPTSDSYFGRVTSKSMN